MITPELITKYRTWDDAAAAQVYDARLRQIERSHAQTFTELGIILVECEARQLWRHAVTSACESPHSFSAWIVDCLPVSNGSAFAALRAAKQLKAIPSADREQIPRGNLETMSSMSETLATSPAIVSAAKSMKPKEFREAIERDHPEQHIEAKKPMRFYPERSGRQVIDYAIEIAMALEECGRDEALEKVCQLYVDDHQYEYEKNRHSKIGVIPAVGVVH
jgi:hypothetical protein